MPLMWRLEHRLDEHDDGRGSNYLVSPTLAGLIPEMELLDNEQERFVVRRVEMSEEQLAKLGDFEGF